MLAANLSLRMHAKEKFMLNWRRVKNVLITLSCAPTLLFGPIASMGCDDPPELIVSEPEVTRKQVEGGRVVTVAADIHDQERGITAHRAVDVFIADNPGARNSEMPDDVVAETTNEHGEKLTYKHNVAMRRMVLQVSGGRAVEVLERRDGNLLYKNNIYANNDASHVVIAEDANRDLGPIDPHSITILNVADRVVSEEEGVEMRAAVLPFLGPIIKAIAEAAGAIYTVWKDNQKPRMPNGAA